MLCQGVITVTLGSCGQGDAETDPAADCDPGDLWFFGKWIIKVHKDPDLIHFNGFNSFIHFKST